MLLEKVLQLLGKGRAQGKEAAAKLNAEDGEQSGSQGVVESVVEERNEDGEQANVMELMEVSHPSAQDKEEAPIMETKTVVVNMDSIVHEADQSMGKTYSRDLLSFESPDISDIVGEPLVPPRIGNEYQVQIPPLLTESQRLQLLRNPAEDGMEIDVSHCFLMGLPVPITWISEVKTIKDEPIGGNNDPTVAEYSNGCVNSVNGTKSSQNSVKEDQDFKVHTSNHLSRNSGKFPVPGLPAETWSDFEVDCYLLGLYIFGKNLLQVGRFMGKDLGQILPFYYGRFYRSPRYCRWSVCRKMKNKKCVVGQLFSGGRQQELFSRLLPRLSEQSKSTLQEVSKAYTEGRTSLEDYVSTLKRMVGLHALIEVVGIGKGKEDLTTLVVETSKTAHMFTSHPEIPSGNACSSLTCAEIIKFLTGGFRLSKARSNDLFWEAVWPRLLAKGWHSEQPKNEGYKGTKNWLVFLMPGVKKFSRRKLVKGDHFFDSVSDVLSKVASEPQLLELEAGETRDTSTSNSNSKAENGWAAAAAAAAAHSYPESDDDNASDNERHRYLKPRVATSTVNVMKFTIVDTSLADDEKPEKIRELRSLPFHTKSPPPVLRNEPREEPVASDAPLKNYTNASHAVDLANGNLVNQKPLATASNSPKPSNGSLESLAGHDDSSLSPNRPSRTIKHQFSRRPKVDRPNSSLPALKRRKLLACTVAITMPSLAGEECHGALSSPAQETDIASLASSLAEMSVMDSVTAGNSQEKSQKFTVVNTSQEHEDKPEAEAPTRVKVEPETVLQTKVESEGEKPPGSSESIGVPEEKTVGSRRQSTRIRPLTTRALEALEIGLLIPKQTRKKRPRAWSLEDKKPKVSGRPRVRNTGSTSFKVDQGTNSRGSGCYKVSDSVESSPIGPHVGNSKSANCGILKGTESEEGTAQTYNQKSSPSGQTDVKKTESMSAHGSVCDRMPGTLDVKLSPSSQAQESNSDPVSCFIGGSTEHKESGYARVFNMAQTLDLKSRPVRNSEATNCNVAAEGAKSKGSECVMDPKSRSCGSPHIRSLYTTKCSVGEATKSVDSGYAMSRNNSLVETPNRKPRPCSQLRVRYIKTANYSAGEGFESGGSIYARITNSMASFPPVRPDVRNTESANCSIGEGTTSGVSGSNRVSIGREQTHNHRSMPDGRPHIRNSEFAICSPDSVTESGGSGYDRVSITMGEKPKQKSRPSGRSRARKIESASRGVGEGTETNGVSNSMTQTLNNPLYQANQQVARELLGFSRPSKYPKS